MYKFPCSMEPNTDWLQMLPVDRDGDVAFLMWVTGCETNYVYLNEQQRIRLIEALIANTPAWLTQTQGATAAVLIRDFDEEQEPSDVCTCGHTECGAC